MSKNVISTPGAPAAIGPYVQGVRAGNLIFTAGQIALDPATMQVVAGGIAEQTTRALENLKAVLEAGGTVVQETRGWDDGANETYSQRKKESSHDYRYYPDPDIPKLKISEIKELSKETIAKTLPESPWAKRDRYKSSFGMTDKEVAVFVDSPEVSNYFEIVISRFNNDPKKIKLAVNYILTDYLGLLKKSPDLTSASKMGPIKPETFTDLVELIAIGDISSRGAKDLLVLLLDNGGAVSLSLTGKAGELKSIAEKNDLIQKSDLGALAPIIEQIIASNTNVVAEYKAGKTASLQFLIGQAMKATKGSANPEMIKKLFIEKVG